MKGKKKLLTDFDFFIIRMVEMLLQKVQSLCNFSFLKIVEIEPANKVQIFFLLRDAFSAHKTSPFISSTSLIETPISIIMGRTLIFGLFKLLGLSFKVLSTHPYPLKTFYK
jgi:hypothetical protein